MDCLLLMWLIGVLMLLMVFILWSMCWFVSCAVAGVVDVVCVVGDHVYYVVNAVVAVVLVACCYRCCCCS